MRSSVFALALAFGGLQMVAFVDCCCGSFCTHKNSCTGCQDEKNSHSHDQEKASDKGVKRSCCTTEHHSSESKENKEQNKRRCSHLEPSQDVSNQAPELLPSADFSEAVVLLALDPAPIPETSPLTVFLPEAVPESPPGLPRHLLFSVLQI